MIVSENHEAAAKAPQQHSNSKETAAELAGAAHSSPGGSAGAADVLGGTMAAAGSVALPRALSKLHLLLVDDDLPVLKACAEIASGMGFKVHTSSSAEAARATLTAQAPDVVLMDLKMPGGGLALLEEIRLKRPRSAVVVMTAFATVSSAVEAMRIGATDYLTKPFAMDELTAVLERAAQTRHFELENRRVQGQLRSQGQTSLLGVSLEMQRLHRIVSKVANANHPVVILGEGGTGKETVARTIHANGPNATRRFAVVECEQLAPSVLESELFGYAKTAHTGFDRPREGLLAAEGGGTVYIDGISELTLDLQAKLTRALHEKQIRAPGALQTSPMTVRVLAGSSRNLQTLVTAGQFRKDLYYRLNVVTLRIPPLRERREDIPLLVEHFLERLRRESAVAYRFAPDAMQVLERYDWPGNVRELEGAIERACALSSGPVLHLGDLPSQLRNTGAAGAPTEVMRFDERMTHKPVSSGGRPSAPIVSIAELEREAILHTIRKLKGDKLMAAKLLGIGKTTLYRKLKEYGISDT